MLVRKKTPKKLVLKKKPETESNHIPKQQQLQPVSGGGSELEPVPEPVPEPVKDVKKKSRQPKQQINTIPDDTNNHTTSTEEKKETAVVLKGQQKLTFKKITS